MGEALTADQIKALLGLTRHPTCGFTAVTFNSDIQLPASVLPAGYSGARNLGMAMYFMVTLDAHIAMHRIPSDQVYHHYLGDPLDVIMLLPDGSGRIATVGSDLAAGIQPQLFLPRGTFHMGRLRPGGSYALLATTEWIGVDPSDVERGDRAKLQAAYPAMADDIARFMG